jgi:hypothetical protein
MLHLLCEHAPGARAVAVWRRQSASSRESESRIPRTVEHEDERAPCGTARTDNRTVTWLHTVPW